MGKWKRFWDYVSCKRSWVIEGASRPRRCNQVSPVAPEVDVDQPEPQPNVERNAGSPVLPVDGNNARQPISSPQPSDDGAVANVAVNHEQRRNLRPLAQADRDEGLCQEVYDIGGSGDPEIIPTADPQGMAQPQAHRRTEEGCDPACCLCLTSCSLFCCFCYLWCWGVF